MNRIIRVVTAMLCVLTLSAPATADETGDTSDARDDAAYDETTDLLYAVGITGIVLGSVSGLVGYTASRRVAEIGDDPGYALFQNGVPTNQNVCDVAAAGQRPGDVGGLNDDGAAAPAEVAAMCDEADDLELVQAVTLSVAAAGITAGIVMVAVAAGRDGDNDAESAVHLLPVVSPGYAGALFSASF